MFKLIWRRDVGQRQISVKTTFASLLDFSTLNNVKYNDNNNYNNNNNNNNNNIYLFSDKRPKVHKITK